MSDSIEIPMSSYNRLHNSVLECVALYGVKRGSFIIIEDEPETREYKNYKSLLPYTMGDILAMCREEHHDL